MNPYFIFNNIDSTDYLMIETLPSIFKSAKDIKMIEIEGRDGFLTNNLGSYRSIIKSVECWVKDLSQIDYICSWLTGGGEVMFSNEPDKNYKAIIINQIEFSKVLLQFHSFIIQFNCQPHKYSINNAVITLTIPSTIFNSGCDSKPIIKIYGVGTIDLLINNKPIHLTNVNEHVIIDSEMMDCYNNITLRNNNMLGDFPILQAGNNEIHWGGIVSSIEITPNWRYL